jgi:hypothetical protein
MKKALYILMAVSFIAISSCKKRNTQAAIVIHDCMGQYLRFDNKDHPICNTKMVDKFATGTVVQVTFVSADNNSTCDDINEIHCMTMHGYPVQI